MGKKDDVELTRPTGADVELRERKRDSDLQSKNDHSKSLGSRSPERGRSERIPLSHAQERLWFLDELGLAGVAYNMALAVRWEGNLSEEILERSLNELIRRHDTLRTRFLAEDGIPYQIVDPPLCLRLRKEDLSRVEDSNLRAKMWRELTRQEQLIGFDLSKPPPIRVTLVKFSDGEHLLLVVMHHIVSDGWSLGVLMRELAILYAAYSQGHGSPLPELTVQYWHYATQLRKALQTEHLQEQLCYWKTKLANAPPRIDLPTDRPRPRAESFRGAEKTFEVPPSVLRALKELAARERCTLFMVLLAAYQCVLSRWSGERDIIVGCPVAGRDESETEGVIGLFVNMLALRAEVIGGRTFRTHLAQVRAATIEAYENHDVPFDAVVREIRPDRALTHQPVVQAVLALQTDLEKTIFLNEIRVSSIHVERVTTHFDLTLHLQESSEGLVGRMEYAVDLFDDQSVERMAEHFQLLLGAIGSEPDCLLDALPMITPREFEQVVREFNRTAVGYPKEKTISGIFEMQVNLFPRAVAVIDDDRSFTYEQVNDKANQLARYLVWQGLQPGDCIPVLMSRSLQLIIAQLAILKSGGIYVPLDPAWPAERLVFVVRDCRAHCMLTDQVDRRNVLAGEVQLIEWSMIATDLAEWSSANLTEHASSAIPAYVMYTSGSTGAPKGVVVPQCAVNRLVINGGYAEIAPSDCIAHCSNPAFDASTFEVWAALLNGARCLIVPHSIVLDGESFASILARHRVTILWMTVGLFAQYAEAHGRVFKQLRYLLTGGDVVEPGTVRRVLRDFPPGCFLNMYGPTECTTFSSSYRASSVAENECSIPIGRPISNSQVYILDEGLRPVPVRVTGEIYIGGAGLARGYVNRPGMTAERFVANPFGHGGERLYKTGDLGRWRSDGNIEFVGRRDQQVKLRGFRVELGEIETYLARHANVKEAVVVARGDLRGSKCLVAYVTSRHGSHLSVEDLVGNLDASLPAYMIPSAFVVLESLPLTSNGKVDRRALPIPANDAYVRRAYEAPQGRIEQTLAGIWQEMLNIEQAGAHDSFFSLGGHSLLAIKLASTINKELGCSLTVRGIYMYPTLRALAAHIHGEEGVEDHLVNLEQEATLDLRITTELGRRYNPSSSILMTGVTGFVGRFLLRQLLRDTSAIIHCVVRATSDRDALLRIKNTLVSWDLWRDEFAERLVAVPGDLRLPNLGIDRRRYEALSEEIDTIYHCGTSMNHLETYEMAKSANVGSARELIKFATTKRQKTVNYISTLSIFSPSTIRDTRIITEATPIENERHSAASGYAASKWVAEKIFLASCDRGALCNIFRLGFVWADTQQGRYDELQREYRLLKSCLLSGLGIQNYRYPLAPTPVDCVAGAVVCLAKRPRPEPGVFHISSCHQETGGLFERLNETAGTALELLPISEWARRVRLIHAAGRPMPIAPLMELVLSRSERLSRTGDGEEISFDCSRTLRELGHQHIAPPWFNDELLRKCVESMYLRDEELRELSHLRQREQSRSVALTHGAYCQ